MQRAKEEELRSLLRDLRTFLKERNIIAWAVYPEGGTRRTNALLVRKKNNEVLIYAKTETKRWIGLETSTWTNGFAKYPSSSLFIIDHQKWQDNGIVHEYYLIPGTALVEDYQRFLRNERTLFGWSFSHPSEEVEKLTLRYRPERIENPYLIREKNELFSKLEAVVG